MVEETRKKLNSLLIRFSPIISDELFIRIQYRLLKGGRLNLSKPATMDEKLQWLKIHNRDPRLTQLVDKLAVKQYIAETIGEQYVCPVLKTWDSVGDISLDDLPDSFVLKTNHSGGNTGVVLCKDKSSFDLEAAKEKLESAMHTDIYRRYREWPYKNVPHRVFAEKYLGDNLTDYKFYCFNGTADCVLTCVDRQLGDPKFYFFDRDWKLCRYNKRGKEAPADFTLPRPGNIDELFDLAALLSKGFPFVRMDFFDVDGKIYFGEFTFYPASGYDPNRLPETDLMFGNKIDLGLIRKSNYHN